MTPQDATIWLRQFAHWGRCNALSIYAADMFGAHIELGKFGKVPQIAQIGRWHDRRLCIFVRRLVRLVDGYERPACGWCSDTGVVDSHEHRRPMFCRGARTPDPAQPYEQPYDTSCPAACALISERYRPKTAEESERDRKNLDAARGITTAAQRSLRWQGLQRSRRRRQG